MRFTHSMLTLLLEDGLFGSPPGFSSAIGLEFDLLSLFLESNVALDPLCCVPASVPFCFRFFLRLASMSSRARS